LIEWEHALHWAHESHHAQPAVPRVFPWCCARRDPNEFQHQLRFQGRGLKRRGGLERFPGANQGGAGAKTINLLYFAYSNLAPSNGASFLNFSDSKKHQYLVFLKKEDKGELVPVTGHYDAALSVKKIVKDHFLPIDKEKKTQQKNAPDKK
jgi:hypothetical protein